MTDEKPTFTEDDVAGDFFDAIDIDVVGNVGHTFGLRPYECLSRHEDDEDNGCPFTVVRDGREFEVDIYVRVTELTPERKAARAEREQRILADLERYSKQKAAES
jgi:hypothetical protein